MALIKNPPIKFPFESYIFSSNLRYSVKDKKQLKSQIDFLSKFAGRKTQKALTRRKLQEEMNDMIEKIENK